MTNDFYDKSAKLIKVKPYKVNDRWYLRLIYEYKNDNGDIFELEIPMAELPFTQMAIPDIITSNDGDYPWSKAYFIRAFLTYVDGMYCVPIRQGKSTIIDNAEGFFFRKSTRRKMTIEDIEKELGYSVEIVDKE